MQNQIFDPNIPYSGLIYGSVFEPGKFVRIEGVIPTNAHRFDVNLQCGYGTAPKDIAIQVSVEVLDGYVSLNSSENGIWGEEICRRVSTMGPGAEFGIVLMSNVNHCKVIINGQHYCDVPHKILYHRITHLTINGDVSIFKISYDIMEAEDSNFPNASVPLLSGKRETVALEMTPSRRVDPSFSSAVTPPPSYESSKQPPLNEFTNGAANRIDVPYPTSSAYPVGPPYPTHRQHAINPTFPVHESGRESFYDVDRVRIINNDMHLESSTLNYIPPPPPGAPIPLNATSVPVTRQVRKKPLSGAMACCIIVSCIVAGLCIALIIIFSITGGDFSSRKRKY